MYRRGAQPVRAPARPRRWALAYALLAGAGCLLGLAASAPAASAVSTSRRCVATQASAGSKTVLQGGAHLRLAGASPLRRGGQLYLPLSFLRSALGMTTRWSAHTGQVWVTFGPLTLQARIGRGTGSLNGQRVKLAGSVAKVAGEPALPARGTAESLGLASAQNPAATNIVIVPPCAVGTSQATPYLRLLASSLHRRAPRRGERLGVIGSVLSASGSALLLRETPIEPALAGGSKPLLSESRPAYEAAGRTVAVLLTPATRSLTPTPPARLKRGTPVLVSGELARGHLVADSVIDLALAPPPAAAPARLTAARGAPARPLQDLGSLAPPPSVGATLASAAAAQASAAAAQAAAGPASTVSFGGQYLLPAFRFSSPVVSTPLGCATLKMHASVLLDAAATWDWPMRFAGSTAPPVVALQLSPEGPAGNSFSVTADAVVSLELALQLKCGLIDYEVDLGEPTVAGTLAAASSAPGPLGGQPPVVAQPIACLDVAQRSNPAGASGAWGLTAAAVELCPDATIGPAPAFADVAVSGLVGATGDGFAITASNDPLRFSGTPDGSTVTLSFGELAYSPPVTLGVRMRALALQHVIYNSPALALAPGHLQTAIGAIVPTIPSVVLPVPSPWLPAPPVEPAPLVPLCGAPTVTPPAGPAPETLTVKDLVKGSGAEAKFGGKLEVNDIGVLFKDGTLFESSCARKAPFSFVLGHNEVIAGWEQGIAGMRVGGQRELVIPPSLAYGAKGKGTIPPNETLVFVVELLSAA